MRIRADSLDAIRGVSHGFFTRKGGYSRGVHASLNTGLGADEDTGTVLKNRQLVAETLGVKTLVTPYQYHSGVVHTVHEPWDWRDPPRADALVTSVRGIAIAVNTADCTPVLFGDVEGHVVGVAHAGWRGAIGGVLEATVAAMKELGVAPSRVAAVIGPTISQDNYEVGPEFYDTFVADDAENDRFFIASQRDGHRMFDLPGYVGARLARLGLASVHDCALCTYGHEDRFFSYRRMTHRGEPDYGRQMSAICLV